ncbi:YveK family protein [Oceanirhabdus seepicola]|uniref:Capsular biosynthesis protein n=1 Tax=Oceanirhabdus seepicola TaxID=2828781 RepID=A0A9J6P4F4_9CLOT|nr:Wzz/FepE/Etk N-terminal domain-containing protein [Oceanirhabdus seepicola]MCM1990496.1 capsular biosynthesis protein [Oceanirhabdus seepicola]
MGEEVTLDLKELFFVLKKRSKLIIAVTLGATLLSAMVSFFFLSKVYQSSSSIVIGTVKSTNNPSYEYNDVMMYQKLIKTFAEIAKAEDTAEEAIKEHAIMGKDENELMLAEDFVKMLSVSPQSDTQIINIKIENKDPEKAAKMVNALSESFIERVTETFPEVNIDVINVAKIPEKPIKPNKKLNVAIAFLLGLMVSVGICFLLEYMDTSFKTEEQVEKILGLPVIGGIPKHDIDG